jgi:hypothetical protein
MTRDRQDLRRLHFINALFAHATGQDLYLADQIKSAIALSLADFESQLAAHPEFATRYDAAFNAAAAELLARLFGGLPRHGFYHWDAALTLAAATPLFTRAEIMQGLRRLAGYREATLLVTNLRPALIPPGQATLLVTNLRPALIPPGRRAPPGGNASTTKPSPSSATSPPPAPCAARTCTCCFCNRTAGRAAPRAIALAGCFRPAPRAFFSCLSCVSW